MALSSLLLTLGHTGAQGIVDFENGIYPPLAILTNSVPGGPPTGPISGPIGSYYFGLFSAPSGTTDPHLFTFTGNYATNTTTAGVLFDTYPAMITNSAPNTWVSLLVRGWSANIGSDVTALKAYLANPTFTAWYGESQIGLLELGDPNDISGAPLVFGVNQFPGVIQIPGFTLGMYPVVALRSAQLGTNGFFSFDVAGPTGVSCTVQSTTDFVHWSALTNVVLTNGAATVQTPATNSTLHFYRAKFPSN